MGFAVALLLGVLALSGCAAWRGSAGSLRAESLGDDPVALYGNFQSVYFSHDIKGMTSFMLADAPLKDILAGEVANGQMLHVQLLWLPKAGSTPMEASATNASLRYVVIANGEVGIYSGAGFAMPEQSLESSKVTLTLRDASLQLQESTAGFADLLSPAQMTGSFTAIRDEQKTRQLNRAASQLVTNALGKTRLVKMQTFTLCEG